MTALKNKKAEGYILTCVMAVLLSMLIATFIYFMATVSMVKLHIEDTKNVLDSFIIENAIEVYDSVKLGNDSQDALRTEAFTEKLCSFCHLQTVEEYLYSFNDEGKIKYGLTKPQLISDNNLKVTATYNLRVPIYFRGYELTFALIPIKINAYYSEKF